MAACILHNWCITHQDQGGDFLEAFFFAIQLPNTTLFFNYDVIDENDLESLKKGKKLKERLKVESVFHLFCFLFLLFSSVYACFEFRFEMFVLLLFVTFTLLLLYDSLHFFDETF